MSEPSDKGKGKRPDPPKTPETQPRASTSRISRPSSPTGEDNPPPKKKQRSDTDSQTRSPWSGLASWDTEPPAFWLMYPPSEAEAQWYYYGLPSQPRLIARLSGLTQQWQPGSGPNARPPIRTLSAVDDDEVCDQWEEVRDEVIRYLEEDGIQWCSLDLISLAEEEKPGRPTIWIGMEEANYRSARRALFWVSKAVLEYESLCRLDVQIRKTQVVDLAPPWLPPDTPLDDISAHMRPLVGINIAPLDAPYTGGTGGVYLKAQNSRVFLLTARHVLLSRRPAEIIIRPHSPLPPRAVLFSDWGLQLLQYKSEGSSDDLHGDEERSRQTDTVAATHKWAELQEPESRVIGDVFAAPLVTFDQRFTEDWALIRLNDDTEALNAIYLGEASSVETKMEQQIKTDSEGMMMSITHILPDAQARRSKKNVMMRAAISGLSYGRTSGTSSIRRMYQGKEVKTTEYCIVGKRGLAFSKKGDSGGVVVDANGGVSGMVTSGNGMTEATDVTYATPIWWILERCNAFTGEEFSLL